MRIWVRSGTEIVRLVSDFQGPATDRPRTPLEPRCFAGTESLAPNDSVPGSSSLRQERKPSPGPPPASPRERTLPPLARWRERERETPPPRPPSDLPCPGAGILTRFPFGCEARSEPASGSDAPVTFRQELSRPLGSTDPWSTAVPMEPFSTSVLQGPTGVFATTTKICSGGSSGRARARHLPRLPPCPSYSPVHIIVLILHPAARYGRHARAPSIFRAGCFGR
jgi:hypothetical protein